MVSSQALSVVCVEMGLADFLQHCNPTLAEKIDKYQSAVLKAQKKEMILAKKEGRQAMIYWGGIVTPKVRYFCFRSLEGFGLTRGLFQELSDVIEALLGAVLISDKFDSQGATSIYQRLMKPFFEEYIRPETYVEHPTTRLCKLFQERRCKKFQLPTEPVGGGKLRRRGQSFTGVGDRSVLTTCDWQSSSTTLF